MSTSGFESQNSQFIALNIFLHLTHIYATYFNFFTYLKMTVDRSKRRFMSVIFTVLSFKKPLLIRHSPSILYCNSYQKFSNICKLENRLVWPAEIVLWKSNTRCSDQLCSCLWTSRCLVLNILADTISYYLFKLFPRFWLTKSTRIIHHNRLLMTKFGRILRLINRWRQKAASL